MTSKVQITMTVEQACTMMKAMDFYMRIQMGQFEELEHMFIFFGEEAVTFNRKPEDREKLHVHLKWLKKFIYPDLEENAYWGITGKPCPERATLIYDIYKSMDNAISWFQHPDGGLTVNFDKPMHCYTKIPLPYVKVFEE